MNSSLAYVGLPVFITTVLPRATAYAYVNGELYIADWYAKRLCRKVRRGLARHPSRRFARAVGPVGIGRAIETLVQKRKP